MAGRNLLIDTHRPNNLSDLDFNKDINAFLSALAADPDMPHLILEGDRGSGKKLRMELFLKAKYGAFKILNVALNIDIPGKTEKKIIHTLTSPYHYQINPSIHSIYDRSLVQVFISEIIQYKILTGNTYRIIVIEDADLLSEEAQESLRRTLETCIGTCRFIFLCNKEGKVIQPIYSRCVRVKLASPTVDEIVSILQKMDDRNISIDILKDIAGKSNRNLTKAIHYFNKYILLSKNTDGTDPEFIYPDYNNVYKYCMEIIDNLISGSRLEETFEKKIRKQLYELVNYCVDCKSLIITLLNIALSKIPASEHTARYELCKIASERDTSIRSSSKAIYHVESFCLHIFYIIKVVMGDRAKAKTKAKKATEPGVAKTKTIVKEKAQLKVTKPKPKALSKAPVINTPVTPKMYPKKRVTIVKR